MRWLLKIQLSFSLFFSPGTGPTYAFRRMYFTSVAYFILVTFYAYIPLLRISCVVVNYSIDFLKGNGLHDPSTTRVTPLEPTANG